MEKTVSFSPAYDENHSIHGVNLRFLLKGPEGAVQFLLSTNWHLPHIQSELEGRVDHLFCHPLPADLGYHSPVPRYERHEPLTLNCDVLGGGPCYYDGSGLNAEPVYERLLREGSAGVWAALEEYYKEIFEETVPCCWPRESGQERR